MDGKAKGEKEPTEAQTDRQAEGRKEMRKEKGEEGGRNRKGSYVRLYGHSPTYCTVVPTLLKNLSCYFPPSSPCKVLFSLASSHVPCTYVRTCVFTNYTYYCASPLPAPRQEPYQERKKRTCYDFNIMEGKGRAIEWDDDDDRYSN